MPVKKIYKINRSNELRSNPFLFKVIICLPNAEYL